MANLIQNQNQKATNQGSHNETSDESTTNTNDINTWDDDKENDDEFVKGKQCNGLSSEQTKGTIDNK